MIRSIQFSFLHLFSLYAKTTYFSVYSSAIFYKVTICKHHNFRKHILNFREPVKTILLTEWKEENTQMLPLNLSLAIYFKVKKTV